MNSKPQMFTHRIIAVTNDSQFKESNKREDVWSTWSICELGDNWRCNGLHSIFDDLHVIVSKTGLFFLKKTSRSVAIYLFIWNQVISMELHHFGGSYRFQPLLVALRYCLPTEKLKVSFVMHVPWWYVLPIWRLSQCKKDKFLCVIFKFSGCQYAVTGRHIVANENDSNIQIASNTVIHDFERSHCWFNVFEQWFGILAFQTIVQIFQTN